MGLITAIGFMGSAIGEDDEGEQPNETPLLLLGGIGITI